ncbi:exodeoxyribonuclease VII small subunit [Georgenia wangjunii]|uniref:exodeoxyribonuclease VII small subunit n=1 Tax=Georgenia wangjunii TaxID=3117730 RepID=UPI002F2646E0
MSETPLPDVGALTYEQARDELVDVVRRLEAGAASLEDSLALWERGEALAARCQAWLDGARERLEAARADRDSRAGAAADAPRTTDAPSTTAERQDP